MILIVIVIVLAILIATGAPRNFDDDHGDGEQY